MSWFHNQPTKPTFLPPPLREEEITTKDIEACYHGYKTLRWDIYEKVLFLRVSYQVWIFLKQVK